MKNTLLAGALLAGHFLFAQNIGIGTNSPAQKLDVNGTIKTNGLLMPTGANAGQILKTDANGVAGWGTMDAPGLFATVPGVSLSCPVLFGSVGTGDRPQAISIAGNYAYLVNQFSNTLQVINISNPAIPVLAGSVGTGNFPAAVDVAGNFAYIVNDGSNTLQVIDISNPAVPVVTGSVAAGNRPNSVAVMGNYAYVASNTLLVINIANPAAPVVVGSVATGTGLSSLDVMGNYAYLVDPISSTLQVINIANPALPVVTGSISTGTSPTSVAVAGNYAYVVNAGSNTLQVINITNPAAPVLAGLVSTGVYPVSVTVLGNIAYVTNRNSNALQRIYIANPAAPVVVGSVSTGTWPYSVAASGNFAYVVCYGSNSMQAFSIAACSQNFGAGYNTATAQTSATEIPWITNGDNISNSNFGYVGIGTEAPTATLSVNGNANNLSGSWSVFSDARIKTIAGEFEDGLDVIRKINTIRFTYDTNANFYAGDEQLGVTAQQLESVAPYMVTKNKRGKYNDLRKVNNQAYPFLLINAVKTLSAMNNLLKETDEKQLKEIEQQQAAFEKERAVYETRLKTIEAKLAALCAAARAAKKD